MEFEDRPIMKCGCVAMTIRTDGGRRDPWCFTHDCGEIADRQPDLSGRMARCAYFGKVVPRKSYNANACSRCRAGEPCACEQPSTPKLWFFIHKPQEPFDEFYCACHGAD